MPSIISRVTFAYSNLDQENAILQHEEKTVDREFPLALAFRTEDPVVDAIIERLQEAGTSATSGETVLLLKCQKDLLRDAKDIEEDYTRLQNRVTNILHLIAEKRCNHMQKLKQAQLCSSFLSVVRKLPSNVLRLIFIYTLPDEPRPVLSESPMLLRRICSTWYHEAMRCSELWERLFLRYSTSVSHQTTPLVANALSFWATQGNPRNMTLTLESDAGFPDRETHDMHPELLAALLRESSRLRSLTLKYPSEHDIRKIFHQVKHTFTSLDSFSLHMNRTGVFKQPGYFIRSAPNLKKTTLHAPGFFLLILPHSTLEYLELNHHISLTLWRKLFRLFQNLHQCSFNIDTRAVTANQDSNALNIDGAPKGLVYFPFLSKMRLGVYGPVNGTIFQDFDAPNLSTMQLDVSGPATHFGWFLDKPHSHRLQSLSLAASVGTLSAKDVISILRSTPALKNLRIGILFNPHETCVLLESLAVSGSAKHKSTEPGGAAIVPRLANFAMAYSPSGDNCPSAYTTFFVSRWKSVELENSSTSRRPPKMLLHFFSIPKPKLVSTLLRSAGSKYHKYLEVEFGSEFRANALYF